MHDPNDISHLDDTGGEWTPNSPNRVKSDGDSGVSATPLEQTVDAFSHCLLAATYPSDAEQRAYAEQFCQVIGIDYVEALARVMAHVKDPATEELVDADEARWRLADHLGGLVGQMRSHGALTRSGVLRSGLPADKMGFSHDDNDDYMEA